MAIPTHGKIEALAALVKQNNCEFLALTWWRFGGFSNGPSTTWPTVSTDEYDPAGYVGKNSPWARSMESAPPGALPPAAGQWTRYYKLYRVGTERAISQGGYDYTADRGPKLSDIAATMGRDIARVIASAPDIVTRFLPDPPQVPSKVITSGPPAAAKPDNLPPQSLAAQRRRLPHPSAAQSEPRVILNGHKCTIGDRSPECKNVCVGECPNAAEQFRERQQRFVIARRLLLNHGVSFDPNVLLEPGWRTKLRPVLDAMPEMQQNRRESLLEGVILGDTLYVPEAATIGHGPVVIIVNHIVYEGSCPTWKASEPGNTWQTSGLYVFERGASRALGMSLENALKQAGFAKGQFAGGLPSFPVIRDLDLPRPDCAITIDAGAPSASRAPKTK